MSQNSDGVYGLTDRGAGLVGSSTYGVPLSLKPGAPDPGYLAGPGDIYIDVSGNGKLFLFTTNGWKSISFS